LGIEIRKNWEHDADYLRRIGCTTLQPDEIHAATYHICYNGKHTGIGFDVYVKSDGSVRMFIEDVHKSISTNFPRGDKMKDFLGKRSLRAQREITTREFIERVEKQSRMDILVYQLDTCPRCLGELEVNVKGDKTTHKCKNCSFGITVGGRFKT